MSEAQRNSIRMLRGYVFFGIHESLHRPATYVTIIRDPIDRIISHYYYVRHTSNHRFHSTVTSQSMSLKDYVSSGLAKELDNGQVRLLAGRKADECFAIGQCSKDLLEMAKKNLQEHFIVVGLTERFDETLILWKRSFGMEKISHLC